MLPHILGHLRRGTVELILPLEGLLLTGLAAEFPQRFSSWPEALSYAGMISQESSR